MRALLLAMAAAYVLPSVVLAQPAEQTRAEVIRVVAADLAKEEAGHLMGQGPRTDSAGVRLALDVAVDTATVCMLGRERCAVISGGDAAVAQRQLAGALGARMISDSARSPAAKNGSTYSLSDVVISGSRAELYVVLWWVDYVAPTYPHMVAARYVVERDASGGWTVVVKSRWGADGIPR